MTAVITGGHGFLGWHLACRLLTQTGDEPVRLGRAEFDKPQMLEDAVAGAEVVYHLAGINRADIDDDVQQGNVALAERVAAAVVQADQPVRVVYANTIHAEAGTAYGRGKSRAAAILADAAEDVGGSLANVLLPNLFGEHGRPDYNSFVATFASRVAAGEEPTVAQDKEVPLLHAQRAAQALIDASAGADDEQIRPGGVVHAVSAVLEKLREFDRLYRTGEIPALIDPFDVDLFNTYRSYTFPDRFPIHPKVHSDPRGDLFESLRYHGGTAQTYLSTTHPGQVRGEHYHLHKVERFVVVKGRAEIGFRRLLHDAVLTIEVSGDRPAIVDMPTMWVHNLHNVGDEELITFFFSDQLLDPENPDQYFARVRDEEITT